MERTEATRLLLDWVTFLEAATLLGVSSQAVHKMVWEQNKFAEVGVFGVKPIFLLRRDDVRQEAERRQARRKRQEEGNDQQNLHGV